ncbi:MAG: hypothetical protein IJR41_06275 [Atopobiaceae bacterium]|nr:hypothetical protein [Atopobiaceae bacterium]
MQYQEADQLHSAEFGMRVDDPEEIDLMRRAHATANLIFPDKFKGKFFRDAAKRLARCANISYDEALRLLHAGAVGVATKVAEDKMKEVHDG